MLNEDGYDELILYQAPLNLLTLFLYPFMFKKKWMRKAAKFFSKFMFWIENIAFILLMVLYELALVPFVYLKLGFNILTFGHLPSSFKYFPVWLVAIPFLLLAAAVHDLYQFFRILLNYQEDAKLTDLRQEEEDLIKDKIVIYNEMIDVMRIIQDQFIQRRREHRRRKTIGEKFSNKIREMDTQQLTKFFQMNSQ
mmetsp:Transcript_39063/g.37383  ORF Transcript_39063/g.37383 Transcript_39063/m.37383 type:complete len:195 (-) Transcript_39063:478-1062(-)